LGNPIPFRSPEIYTLNMPVHQPAPEIRGASRHFGHVHSGLLVEARGPSEWIGGSRSLREAGSTELSSVSPRTKDDDEIMRRNAIAAPTVLGGDAVYKARSMGRSTGHAMLPRFLTRQLRCQQRVQISSFIAGGNVSGSSGGKSIDLGPVLDSGRG
jgi:hypothetical protein